MWAARGKAAEAAEVAAAAAAAPLALTVTVDADRGAEGSLKQRIETCLFELEADLKVSGVPEAVVLSGFLKV